MNPEQGMYTIAYGMHREKGPVRQENQDQIVHFQSSVFGHLFIVADGMGGHEGGAMAANMAITGFKQHFQNVSLKLPLRESIAEAARLTNLDIFEMSNAKGNGSNPLRMGSTLVLCAISGNFCTVASAGDSRCYSFRNGELKKLTRDHTAAQRMVDSGIISPEEAKNHPEASVLTRAFGQRPEIEIDLHDPFALAPDERLLLCSDGLHGFVDESAIVDRLKKHPDPQSAADALLQLALDAGGHDNISLFVIRVNPPSTKSSTAPDPPVESAPAPMGGAAEAVRSAGEPAASRSNRSRLPALGLLAVAALVGGAAALIRFRPDLVPVPVRARLRAWGVPAGEKQPDTDSSAMPASPSDPAAKPAADPQKPVLPPEAAAAAKPAQFAAAPARTSVFIAFPPTENSVFLAGVADFREQLLAGGYRAILSPKSLQQVVWRPVVPVPANFAPQRLFVSAMFRPGFLKDAVSVCAILSCSERPPKPIGSADFRTFEGAFPAGSVIVFVHPPAVVRTSPPMVSFPPGTPRDR